MSWPRERLSPPPLFDGGATTTRGAGGPPCVTKKELGETEYPQKEGQRGPEPGEELGRAQPRPEKSSWWLQIGVLKRPRRDRVAQSCLGRWLPSASNLQEKSSGHTRKERRKECTPTPSRTGSPFTFHRPQSNTPVGMGRASLVGWFRQTLPFLVAPSTDWAISGIP